MRASALLVLFLGCYSVLAQIKLEPGYFISNDGKRTECTIRHVGWRYNPSKVDYKLEDGEVRTLGIDAVKEFGVNGGPSFYRFTVQIDRSPDIGTRISNDRNPDFKRETLFLRRLVDGKATLYEYFDGIRRYFYTLAGNDPPQQLVYKRYIPLTSSGYQSNYSATNDQYKQQLLNDLKCPAIELREIEALEYEQKPLIRIITRYNDCLAGNLTPAAEVESNARLILRPGAGYNSVMHSEQLPAVTYEKAFSYRLGLQAEIFLRDSRKEWAIPVELVFESFTSNGSVPGYSIDYKAISISGGVRRYFSMGKESRIFAGGFLVYALPGLSSGYNSPFGGQTKMGSGINLYVGAGYQIGKFSVEAGYSLDRVMKLKPFITEISFNGFSLNLGYYLK